ncbi:MAG: transglutaminase family protein [Bacteroidales bacterium]|nr:transglutaminase family protein [Bacteroidales bacterium]MBN2819640.1 transglutaminase family protein [Bacteroidales bacterium]
MSQEVNTLITLLEDNDKEVLNAVTGELVKRGVTVISSLEKAWEQASNQELQERLESVIHNIQFKHAKDKLRNWVEDGAHNLLKGACYIAQFQYPNTNYEDIDRAISKISNDIYLSANNNLSAIEKVKLLNYVIYDLNNFSRNTTNFYSPQNSFINQVLESRKGNPISLGIIYLTVAEKLGLPIFGVNLPKSFILAYKNEFRHYDSDDARNDILFYINPYNKGSILNRREIEHFIVQQNLTSKPDFYVPCDNKSIIERLITNLIIAFQRLGFEDKIKLLEEILYAVNKTRIEH